MTFADLELVFRWLSVGFLGAAATMATLSAVRWSHRLVRPAFRFAAPILWITFAYRVTLAVSALPSGTRWGQFIRLWVNIEFMMWGVSAVLFANATRLFYEHRMALQILEEDE